MVKTGVAFTLVLQMIKQAAMGFPKAAGKGFALNLASRL